MQTTSMEKSTAFQTAVKLLKNGKRLTILTGAGISVESGIPDFRSATGLWERYNPLDYATAQAFEEDPRRCWDLFAELGALFEGSVPNPGHFAVSQMEEFFEDVVVVTQNIDGLHQKSGSQTVLEFHGSISTLRCLSCQKVLRSDTMVTIPAECACGEILKPDIVLFGDPIPFGLWEKSTTSILNSDVVVIIGTSGTVAPFSQLPEYAAKVGIPIIEINIEETPLSNLPTLLIKGKAGAVLPALVKAIGIR